VTPVVHAEHVRLALLEAGPLLPEEEVRVGGHGAGHLVREGDPQTGSARFGGPVQVIPRVQLERLVGADAGISQDNEVGDDLPLGTPGILLFLEPGAAIDLLQAGQQVEPVVLVDAVRMENLLDGRERACHVRAVERGLRGGSEHLQLMDELGVEPTHLVAELNTICAERAGLVRPVLHGQRMPAEQGDASGAIGDPGQDLRNLY